MTMTHRLIISTLLLTFGGLIAYVLYASASTARELENVKERVKLLEDANQRLETRIKALENHRQLPDKKPLFSDGKAR